LGKASSSVALRPVRHWRGRREGEREGGREGGRGREGASVWRNKSRKEMRE